MSEEVKETKTKTTTKRSTKKAPKETNETKNEGVVTQTTQSQSDVDMMFQHFLQFMQQCQVAQMVEEPKQTRIRKTTGKTKTVTKAHLRRKYKEVDVYLVSVVGGSCSYLGRNGYQYDWTYLGDIQAVPVEDVLNMQDAWLKSPWLAIDESENDEELIDDLITCLHLEPIYEHLYILNDIESNIESIDMEKVERVVTKAKDSTLAKDIASIVQEKITNGELTDYHKITDFEKILKCNFRK